MNPEFVKRTLKENLTNIIKEKSTRLLVLQAKIGATYDLASKLSNEQMDLFAEVEALNSALQDMEEKPLSEMITNDLKHNFHYSKYDQQTLQPQFPQVISEDIIK